MEKIRYACSMVKSMLAVSLLIVGTTFGRAEESGRVDLGSIVVTGSKIDQLSSLVSHNVSVITQEEIAASGARDLGDVLDLIPSVDVLEYGSLGAQRSVHVRGASANQVLVLIDGRPVNTPRDGMVDFNMIQLSKIERVEILRGPASSMYGAQAVGGVINIITKDTPADGHTEVSGMAGSFKTGTASFAHGRKIDAFNYFIAYDYTGSRGHRENSEYISSTFNTKLGYRINEKNKLEMSGGYRFSRLGTPGLITSIDLDDEQKDDQKYVDVTYNGSLYDGQDLLVKLYNNTDKLEFIETQDPLAEETHWTKLYGADVQVSQVFFDSFRAAVGGNYLDNRLRSSTSGRHAYFVKAGYFESEVYFFEKSSVKLGARWDDYSNFGDEVSPSASLNLWLIDTVKFHALAAESFRAPTFNDLFWPRQDFGIFGGVEGNPAVKPEEAVSYEAGITGYCSDAVQADITFFKTDYDDLIEWTVDNAMWWRPNNLSSVEIRGIECEFSAVLKKIVRTNLNYTYLRAVNDVTGNRLIYRPKHMYKAGLTVTAIPHLAVNLNGIYKTKRYADPANTQIVSPYFVMNANLTYRVSSVIKAQLGVKNLFDRVYQEQKDFPLPERSWHGGLTLTF